MATVNVRRVTTRQLREAGDLYNRVTRNWQLPLWVVNHLEPDGTHEVELLQVGVDYARDRDGKTHRYLHRAACRLALSGYEGPYLQLIDLVDLSWESWR